MNRVAKRLAYAGLLMVLSCQGTPQTLALGQTFTLQGVVANAVTGARVGGDLKLYLVQGSEIRGPTRLITGNGDPLQGEYAFTGIPVDFSAAAATGNKWKVVAIAGGFERFESEIRFNASFFAGGANSDVIVQQAFSMIGNIYLFPIGTPTPDETFRVTYNGKPVAGAVVQLDPISGSNTTVFSNGGNPLGTDTLPANNGYVPSLQGTATDTNGLVTFPGSQLALGAAYKIQVLPMVYKESVSSTPIQLGLLNLAAIPLVFPGLSVNYQELFLGDLTPATTTEPLFVVDSSNRASDQLTADGSLTLTFNIPVTLVNANNFDASVSGFKADGTTPTAAQTNTVQPVNASISSDGLTVTLRPNFTGTPAGSAGTPAAPAAGDRNIVVHYTEGTALVAPEDYPSKTFSLFGLHFADGTTSPSGDVHMTAP